MTFKRNINAEKKYRTTTGGGVIASEESFANKNDTFPLNTTMEAELWKFFDKTPATVPFREGESAVGKRKTPVQASAETEHREPLMDEFESDSDDEETGGSYERGGRGGGGGRLMRGVGGTGEGTSFVRETEREEYRDEEEEEEEEEARGGGGGGGGRGRAGGYEESGRGGGGGGGGFSSRKRRTTKKDLVEEQFRLCQDQRKFFSEMIHTLNVMCDYINSQKNVQGTSNEHGGLGGGGREPANFVADKNIEDSVVSSQ